jgi:hypothetical protein
MRTTCDRRGNDKKAKALLKLSAEELKGMKKEEVHKGYAALMAHILMDFYVDCSNKEPPIATLADLQQFIAKWLSTRLKPPHEEWRPGDCGK